MGGCPHGHGRDGLRGAVGGVLEVWTQCGAVSVRRGGEPVWPIDPQRFHMTEALIKLRPRDMATFGQLFLQAGQWNGRRLVPAAWIAQATTAQAGKAFPDIRGVAGPGAAFNPTNYGHFWWVEPTTGIPAYYAWGYGGQVVEVVPSLRLVIVVSSHVDETNAHPTVDIGAAQSLVDAIVPIIKSQPTR